ncbi:ATP-binding protein [Vibrio tritonius]|uniref:ATP-binding protein n=1 Tax=Vibrio tritonius TaxID=1435069 RepID=UPI00315DC9C7
MLQPRNTNNSLNNEHAFVVGMSGSGKSSLAKKRLIKPTDQVAIFDPKREYEGTLCGRAVRIYHSFSRFAQALISGRKTKQGFKIAWQPDLKKGDTTPADFDKFCQIVWGCGDGLHTKPLKVICEEVAEHSATAGKATGYHGKLLRLGRSYGIHTVNIFQRGQEVSKTIIDNCQHAFLMMQKTGASAVYLEKMTGIPAKEIDQLAKLEYVHQDGKAWIKDKIRY